MPPHAESFPPERSTAESSILAMPKAYSPSEEEPRILELWENRGSFRADPGRVLRGEAEPYCVVIPPPNVTDRLHLGHALNNTLQDVLVRYHRMLGYEALWMPGTDHAGIATQAVVERRLKKEQNKSRTDYTREQFIALVQEWKDEYETVITGQLKRMGCSCDWARQRFTMDPVCARGVREAFFRLFRDGLIYRGKRLVNWDPALQTAVADDECYDEEVDAHFYYLRYPLVHPHGATTQKERRAGSLPPEDAVPVTWSELAARGYPGAESLPDEQPAHVTVATTRPETYLGDTAVAVNPHDPRAKALRGLCVELPLVGRVIPIVEDEYVVMPEMYARSDEERSDPKAAFATGFLKVTPAHDANDYELYQRHKERMDVFAGGPGRALVNVFAPDARVSDKHGWGDVNAAHVFVGLTREKARAKVLEEFKSHTVSGDPTAPVLLESVKPYRHSVKHSDRSKAVIEPYLSDQWYVKVTDPKLAQSANAALVKEQRTSGNAGKGPTDGELRFHPARYAKTFEQWHDNIRDWCISRQLWWGHRIPVWSKQGVSPAEKERLALLLEVGFDPFRDDEGTLAVQRNQDGDGRETVRVCVRRGDDRRARLLESEGFVQDSDVLDTWFSSALWPLSTLGWPDPAAAAADTGIEDFADLLPAFNPTTTLCTAREIITLWVSRMVMFNRYFMGDGHGRGPAPFRDVFIHALLMDGEGRKMSKSLGNGVDPLDIISSHGTDAMRFVLCQMTTQTQDVRMPVERDSRTGKNTSPKFDLGRNFCNKVWNAARFALSLISGAPPVPGSATRVFPAGSAVPTAVSGSGRPHPVQGAGLSLLDRWLVSRVAWASESLARSLREFQFSEYAQGLYDLIWRDFCDWYLEGIKATVAESASQRQVLRGALECLIRFAHPVVPFVTEALFQRLAQLPGIDPESDAAARYVRLGPPRKGGALCTAPWPEVLPGAADPDAERAVERMRELVTLIREVRAQHRVEIRRRITLTIPAAMEAAFRSFEGLVETFALVGEVRRAATTSAPSKDAVAFVFEGHTLLASDLADALDPAAERARLTKLVGDLERQISTMEARLSNPGYADRAPAKLVEQTRAQLDSARREREAAAAALAGLGA